MAASSLLALIDDIATVLDDVAVISKVAAKKTAGVLGDDLALNAEQVSGVRAERELPVVWAVAKGSFLNKLILVPSALLISAVYPPLIVVLLVIGGLYLCFEGFEKVFHKMFASKAELDNEKQKLSDTLADPQADLVQFEQAKIKGAIRTDFILSAEIIVIVLGTAQNQPFLQQVMVLSALAIAFTVGVYGLVAGIVKLDDLGLYWLTQGRKTNNKLQSALGNALLAFAPFLMKSLSIIGTIAMFLVGGGILAHDIAFLHHLNENLVVWAEQIGWIVAMLTPMLFSMVVGIIAGGVVMAAWHPISGLMKNKTDA